MKKIILTLTLSLSLALSNDNFEDFEDFDEEFVVEERETNSYLKSYNNVITDFNDVVFKNVLTPISVQYNEITSKEGRGAIENFFYNLGYPVRLTNNLLQLKFSNSLDETKSFLINTTFGMFGFKDVSSNHFKIEKHNEDFGQTLGYYNIPAGPHIVLPLLGPSNVRDIVGIGVDSFVDPLVYKNNNFKYNLFNNNYQSFASRGYHMVNTTSIHLYKYENLTNSMIDLQYGIEDFYERQRANEIKK